MLNKINILVVDDSVQCRKQLDRILKAEGYTVKTVNDGSKVEKALTEQDYQLILLDIVMPEIDGFEVMRRLSENPKYYDVPVIFLTGNDDHESKIKAFDLGAVDYVVKPFNASEVRARVKVHLRNTVQTNEIIRNQAGKLSQLEKARDSILVTPESLPDAKFSVLHSAVLEAGGDFYDVVEYNQDRYIYFVADLSGHDIAASYMVPALKALLRNNLLPVYSLDDIISMMNKVLYQILEDDKYLTAFYLVVDRSENRIFWSGAAHPPAILLRKDKQPELLKSEGDMIGMFKNARFYSSQLKINSGDKIILFTDGLVETGESSSVWTAISDLEKNFKDLYEADLSNLPEKIFSKFIKKKSLQEDDVVVLVTEV